MSIDFIDANGQVKTLSSRQTSSTRNEQLPGNWGGGLVNQTDIQSLPFEIEEGILNLANLIKTVNSKDSFQSSVSRVSNPDSILTGSHTFNNGGTSTRVTFFDVPDATSGKTMAYCDLKASSSNEGPLYVGKPNEVNEDNGRELDPGEPMTITIDVLSKVAVYSPNPGNKFSYIVYYES